MWFSRTNTTTLLKWLRTQAVNAALGIFRLLEYLDTPQPVLLSLTYYHTMTHRGMQYEMHPLTAKAAKREQHRGGLLSPASLVRAQAQADVQSIAFDIQTQIMLLSHQINNWHIEIGQHHAAAKEHGWYSEHQCKRIKEAHDRIKLAELRFAEIQYHLQLHVHDVAKDPRLC